MQILVREEPSNYKQKGKYTEGKTKKVIERRYAVKLNTEHDVNNIIEITTNCCFLARKNVRPDATVHPRSL